MKSRTNQNRIRIIIFDMVHNEGSIELGTLKIKAGLSRKQWDVCIKSLTKQGLLKVQKVDENVTVEIV